MQFINCSNHPSANWSDRQVGAVEAMGFNNIVDVPFPDVPADAEGAPIDALIERTAAAIMNQLPTVVFVAGEHAVTSGVVARLQRARVLCVSATTRRISREQPTADGATQKVSVFEFVRWRPYPDLLMHRKAQS